MGRSLVGDVVRSGVRRFGVGREGVGVRERFGVGKRVVGVVEDVVADQTEAWPYHGRNVGVGQTEARPWV